MRKNINEIKYFLIAITGLLLIIAYCVYVNARVMNQIQRDIATDKANQIWMNNNSLNK